MSPDGANLACAICVGDFRCYPIPDGDHLYPRNALCGDDPEQTIGLPEQVLVPYTPLLVDTGAHRILIDTGAGPMAPSTGFLEESLARVGFNVSDIDVVVLSHLHPDHIGGLALEDGTLRFPNARVLMSWREYDFWHSADLRSRLGTGSVYGIPEVENLMSGWIDKYLPPVHDRLEWITGGSEIAPGIEAIDAPGHTPGHLGVGFPPKPNRSCMRATCCLCRTRFCVRTGPLRSISRHRSSSQRVTGCWIAPQQIAASSSITISATRAASQGAARSLRGNGSPDAVNSQRLSAPVPRAGSPPRRSRSSNCGSDRRASKAGATFNHNIQVDRSSCARSSHKRTWSRSRRPAYMVATQ